jgi:hypothetical protein
VSPPNAMLLSTALFCSGMALYGTLLTARHMLGVRHVAMQWAGPAILLFLALADWSK